MGKNNKKPAVPPAAPATQKPAQSVADPNQAALTQHFLDNYSGLSPDAAVTAMERIAKLAHDDPKACEHLDITPEHQKFLNELVLAGMTAMIVVDIQARKSAWAVTMSKTQLDIVKKVALEIGAPFVENYLPTTVATDATDGEEKVEVTMSPDTLNVSAETAKAAEEETTIAETAVEIDPTKFASEEDLKKALIYILTSEKGVFLKFSRTAELLRSYKLIHAENDEQKKEINDMSYGDLLNEVFAIAGRMPLILSGFAKYLYRETSAALNPTLAFLKLRDASKNKTGVPSVSDEALVGIARSLVTYCAEDGIAAETKKIEDIKKDIKVLEKDKKNNAKGIEDLRGKIAVCEANIEHFKDVIDSTHNPQDNIASTFMADFDDTSSDNNKLARKTYSFVIQSYYAKAVEDGAKRDDLKKNVQQMIGIITNMFRNPSDQISAYSTAHLIDLTQEPKN